LEEADPSRLKTGFDLGAACLSAGIDFYTVTSSGTGLLKDYNNGLSICSADETTLKTIVRANPGYLLLRAGTVAGKWSWAGIPSAEEFKGYVSGKDVEKADNKSPVLIVYTAVLSLMVLLLLISSFYRRKQGSSEK
ncbi:MAG: hypothetical protein WAL29_02820, partial [Bacteroidales bacterium]